MLTVAEQAKLNEACSIVPRTQSQYVNTDLVDALLETVIDYQQHTTTVSRAIEHYTVRRRNHIRTMADLEALLARFPDDQTGNTELALHLWGYRLWTRAQQLRGLVAFFNSLGIDSIDALRQWASNSTYRDFAGKVRGLGPAVYQWLVMRLGVDTVKPDVHILRFVSTTIARPVTELEAIVGITDSARHLNCKAYELDWSIWEHQRSAK